SRNATRAPDKIWRFHFEPVAPHNTWPVANEELWIAREITSDVAEMLYFAEGHASLPKDGPLVEVANPPGEAAYAIAIRSGPGAKPLKLKVAAAPALWSPRDYAALASALMQQLGLRPRPKPSSINKLVEGLTDPTPAVLTK